MNFISEICCTFFNINHMEFFVAENISKTFVNHKALNKVSISVPKNSIFGMLGPNGAGKTTLIRIINQITAPDAGKLYFDGEKLRPHHVAYIGYLPEERGLYRKMKVGEQAMYLARLKNVSRMTPTKGSKPGLKNSKSMPGGIKKWKNSPKECNKKCSLSLPYYTIQNY